MDIGFVWDFLRVFGLGVAKLWPLWLVLLAVILGLGLLIGKRERWSLSDTVYYSFITATTVGYGDLHPRKRIGSVGLWSAFLQQLVGYLLRLRRAKV